jgi:hypothetical protein
LPHKEKVYTSLVTQLRRRWSGQLSLTDYQEPNLADCRRRQVAVQLERTTEVLEPAAEALCMQKKANDQLRRKSLQLEKKEKQRNKIVSYSAWCRRPSSTEMYDGFFATPSVQHWTPQIKS